MFHWYYYFIIILHFLYFIEALINFNIKDRLDIIYIHITDNMLIKAILINCSMWINNSVASVIF